MNIQLDKRLGKIWMQVEQQLSLEEINQFRSAVVQAKDFEDLPQVYKDLTLKIESRAEQSAA